MESEPDTAVLRMFGEESEGLDDIAREAGKVPGERAPVLYSRTCVILSSSSTRRTPTQQFWHLPQRSRPIKRVWIWRQILRDPSTVLSPTSHPSLMVPPRQTVLCRSGLARNIAVPLSPLDVRFHITERRDTNARGATPPSSFFASWWRSKSRRAASLLFSQGMTHFSGSITCPEDSRHLSQPPDLRRCRLWTGK